MMRTRVGLFVCLMLCGAAPARAQALGDPAWDSPIFLPPRAGDDIGLYLIDPSGGDWALAGIWRQSGNLNLGVRLGLADGHNETPFFFGAEFYGPLVRADRSFPLDASWVLGVGATLNGGTALRFPVGVSVGRTFDADGIVFTPYAVPRLGIDLAADDGDTDTDLGFTVDLGADLHIDDSWLLRFGVALGDHDALGVGVAYRTGRRAVVR